MDCGRRLHRRPRRRRRQRCDPRLTLAALHGVAAGWVRLGAATWFHDVLVRFGYDLVEHEHPWEGRWFDDPFERAAVDLRAVGAKLVRTLASIDDSSIDAERTPLELDLALGYLRRLVDLVGVAAPCCYGVEGRVAERARSGGLAAVAPALVPVDAAAAALVPPPSVAAVLDPAFRTHDPALFTILDAGAPAGLPVAAARLRERSAAVTAGAVDALDRALGEACPWLDSVLAVLQSAVGERAEDGPQVVERWQDPGWSILCRAPAGVERHLPRIDPR